MRVEIRNATVGDAKALIEYCNIVGGESDNLTFGLNEFSYSLEEQQRFLKELDSNNIYLVAEVEGVIVGTASVTSISKIRLAHNGSLGISVLKKYNNCGIGSELMTNILKQVQEQSNLESIFLEVRSDNLAAVSLYEKYGFEKVGILPQYFKVNDKYFDLDVMHKKIKGIKL